MVFTNYFLILAIIVMVVFFLGLLLNNISKIIQQSELNDVIFTLLGFMLALSIFVFFVIMTVSLRQDYMQTLSSQTISMTVDTPVYAKIQDTNYITILKDNELINVLVNENTKYINNSNMSGKMRLKLITYDAPYAWYMFKWQVDAINNARIYIVDTIYL